MACDVDYTSRRRDDPISVYAELAHAAVFRQSSTSHISSTSATGETDRLKWSALADDFRTFLLCADSFELALSVV